MDEVPYRIIEKLAFCPNTGCWLWAGGWNSGNDYGKISYQGRGEMAHRVLYRLLRGEVPEGLVLDHTCRMRWCCNPWHLEPVTVKVNTLRGDAILFGDVT